MAFWRGLGWAAIAAGLSPERKRAMSYGRVLRQAWIGVLPVAKAPGARGIRWWAGCGDRLGSDGEDRPRGGAAAG